MLILPSPRACRHSVFYRLGHLRDWCIRVSSFGEITFVCLGNFRPGGFIFKVASSKFHHVQIFLFEVSCSNYHFRSCMVKLSFSKLHSQSSIHLATVRLTRLNRGSVDSCDCLFDFALASDP